MGQNANNQTTIQASANSYDTGSINDGNQEEVVWEVDSGQGSDQQAYPVAHFEQENNNTSSSHQSKAKGKNTKQKTNGYGDEME